LLKLARPVVGAPAGLHPYTTGWQGSQEGLQRRPGQPFAQDGLAAGIFPIEVEHMLGEINSYSGHWHRWTLPIFSLADIMSPACRKMRAGSIPSTMPSQNLIENKTTSK